MLNQVLPSWLQAPYIFMTCGWLTCFSRVNSDKRSRSSLWEAFSVASRGITCFHAEPNLNNLEINRGHSIKSLLCWWLVGYSFLPFNIFTATVVYPALPFSRKAVAFTTFPNSPSPSVFPSTRFLRGNSHFGSSCYQTTKETKEVSHICILYVEKDNVWCTWCTSQLTPYAW